MPIQHVLTPDDRALAEEVGRQRILLAPGNPRFAYKEGRSGLDTHRLGAMAELAFARAVGLEWPKRVNTFRELPDVDPFWEVRWSSNPRKVKVAVDDKPDQLVAHVTGEPPAFEIHGFIRAEWVQRNVPATDPGDRGWIAHFVDARHLTPIEPGFHAVCAWFRAPDGHWMCLYCGAIFMAPEQGKAITV